MLLTCRFNVRKDLMLTEGQLHPPRCAAEAAAALFIVMLRGALSSL